MGIRSADEVAKVLLDWIAKYRINEYSDFLGLLLTFVGFALTLLAVWRSRKIAAEALSVAKKVRADLRRVETVADFSSAITAMDEIKRLHRKKEIESLPERYSRLRRLLIELKGENASLSPEDESLLQQAITQFAAFERQIEKGIASGDLSKIDFPKMNRIVSTSTDQIHVLVVRLKTLIGEGK